MIVAWTIVKLALYYELFIHFAVILQDQASF